MQVIATKADLPACEASLENRLYYVAAEKQMYVCIGGAFATSDAPAPDDVASGGTETKNACGAAAPGKIPDVVAVAGQVNVSLPEGIASRYRASARARVSTEQQPIGVAGTAVSNRSSPSLTA